MKNLFTYIIAFVAMPCLCFAMVSPTTADMNNKAQTIIMQGPFYFVDAPISSIFNTLEALLDKPIIYPHSLPRTAKFTFKSEKKIPHDDAVKIFRAMLMLNGIALIPVDDKYYKAVPSSGVSSQAPEFILGRASDKKPSQNFYTKFFELEYIRVADIEGKLKSSLSPNNVGVFESFPKSNSFWVTDTLVNLQRIEKIIEKLDVSLNKTEFIAVKKASASELRDKINSLGLDVLKDATISADARTNQIIATGPKYALEQIKMLVVGLDVSSEAVLKGEVVYLKHGEAIKVAEVLTKIVNSQKVSKSTSRFTQEIKPNPQLRNGGSSQVRNPPLRGSNSILEVENSDGIKNTSDMSGMEFSEYVQIVSEERSNAIVIYGTSNDIKQLKSIIEKLDIVLLQVKIDVLITEVSLSDDQVSGLSSFGLSYNTDENNGFSGETKTYSLSNASNPAFSVFASEKSFSMLFDLARQNQNVKVLSAPTIVTTHNKEAEVNISQSLPIITSSMSDMTSITTTRSSVSYKDIGIKLIVTPLVGANGSIQLKIDQSVDSISGYTTIDNNQQPIISKRRATSFVSAKSNEIITLAGLQQVDTTEIDGGVWLLGDIPILGELFRPSKNEYKRRELIIFIRPAIVKSLPSDETVKLPEVENSPAANEIKTFYERKKFYPNGELEEKSSNFEKNRIQNRLLYIFK